MFEAVSTPAAPVRSCRVCISIWAHAVIARDVPVQRTACCTTPRTCKVLIVLPAGLVALAGLVPQEQGPDGPEAAARTTPGWRVRSVSGLMARSVADLALGLDAVVGQHPEDPL